MVITAVRDLKEGDEVTIAYTELLATAGARRRALAPYGFVCQCPACAQPDVTLHDAYRLGLVHMIRQLDDFEKGNPGIADHRVALGLATAAAQNLNSTRITGQILDET